MLYLAIILSVTVGLAMAAQSPTNASLGHIVGTVQASLTNFAVGWVLCLVLVIALGTGDLSRITQAPLWMCIGGVYGTCIILTLVISTPKLGVAMMICMSMLGQLVGGMLVDSFGLAGASMVDVTPMRLVGCAVVVAGIYGVYRGTGSGQMPKENMPYMLLPLVGGIIASLQPPTNAALGGVIGNIEATFVNFTVGTVLLLIMALVANKGKLNPYHGAKPWQFTGGAYGVFGVFAAIVGSPALGMSLWNVGTMLGQLVGGMAVDALGLFSMRKIGVNSARVVGAALVLVGIVLVTAGKM